jgi:quercetin dioxygenase-like cupin family protein
VSVLDVFQVDPALTREPPEPANFTGLVRLQNLHSATGATSVEALIVHFPAGARTRPHTHPGEQILHFVRGSGFVHLAGEDEQRVPEGGVVIVPAGVVHMHGATGDGPVVHVAIRAANGATNWRPDGVPGEWAELAS